MEDWVAAAGARIVILFEGRDAAGKGGTIKRITQYMNPRVTRIAALPKPTERERTQWYFQRYIANLPSAGEIVLFDRSWYNRAGVEVLGFCTPRSIDGSLRQVPIFERLLVEDGIVLLKYWFSVSDEEQSGASAPGSTIRCDGGSSRTPTCSPGRTGWTSRARRTRCSCTPTSPRRRGTSSRRTTSPGRD